MALRLILSLGLLAAASCRVWGPTPRYHRHGMRVGASEISIDVPPPESRDPEKCELYENIDYMEQGCEQHCSVNGYFGRIRFQDAHPRQVATCKAAGSYCRVPIITHRDMNVTFSNGRCNSDCECEPNKPDEEVMRGIKNFVGSLVTSRHHSQNSHHLLHNGQNHFGVIRLRIPAPSERNQTACEDYENGYYSSHSLVARGLQCKDVCTLDGGIGGLQFEGAPRVLKTNKSDGSYCELQVSGEGKIEVSGVQEIVQGRCHKGICRSLSWKEPEEIKPMMTLSPGLRKVHFKSVSSSKDVSDNSIDNSGSSSASSSSSSSSSEELRSEN